MLQQNTNVSVVMGGDTTFETTPVQSSLGESPTATLEITDRHANRVSLVWSTWSPDECQQALDQLEQMEAAIDNLVSAIRVRQAAAERAAERAAVGGGAGASVEADRG